MSNAKILLGVSGSIAAFKSAALASQLVKAGFEVQVVATQSALKFVGEATFEGLTDRPVFKDVFAEGRMMDHISLARWADLYIIAPASAATLNRFAYGLADDPLTVLFLALERHKPVLMAPAMNSVMFAHPTVQEALVRLRSYDVQIIEPNEGLLACGETGAGRMAEPHEIFERIETALKEREKDSTERPQEPATPSKGKILITSGGTREPLDGVRAITNFSTGRTGAALADHFIAESYDVTFVHARNSIVPQGECRRIEFETYDDLASRLEDLLSNNHYDMVLHLAAVSDFSVDKISTNDGDEWAPDRSIKLGSDKALTLHLKQNPKLITQLKGWSKNPEIKVIAYKLTHTSDLKKRDEAISSLLDRPQVDLVVHNDLSEITPDRHVFRLYDKEGMSESGETKKEMAEALLRMSLRKPEVTL